MDAISRVGLVASPVVGMGLSFDEAVSAYLVGLRGRNLSGRTVHGYEWVLGKFREYLEASGYGGGLPLGEVDRSLVERFLVEQLGQVSKVTGQLVRPATVHNMYRALKAFFNWCADVDYVRRSPMLKIKGPKQGQELVPVLPRGDVVKLLSVCMGDDFESRRDMAIMLCLFDTGVRRSELVSMEVSAIEWQERVVPVWGKGSKRRLVAFGGLVEVALTRYVEVRDKSKWFDEPSLWLGYQGPLGGNGVHQMLVRRRRQAGLVRLHAHQFRHSFAHYFLFNGGQEADLATLLGWSSPAPVMLKRYAASLAGVRAKNAHRQYGPGDRL